MSDYHDKRLRRMKRNPIFLFHYTLARWRLKRLMRGWNHSAE